MSQIVDDLRQVAIEIKTETQVGGNTAARVGGAFERVADALEGTQQIEDMDAAVAAVQQAAAENEQTIQNIVNSLAVVQTTGQSTSDVMSQKAVTDEITSVPMSFALTHFDDFCKAKFFANKSYEGLGLYSSTGYYSFGLYGLTAGAKVLLYHDENAVFTKARCYTNNDYIKKQMSSGDTGIAGVTPKPLSNTLKLFEIPSNKTNIGFTFNGAPTNVMYYVINDYNIINYLDERLNVTNELYKEIFTPLSEDVALSFTNTSFVVDTNTGYWSNGSSTVYGRFLKVEPNTQYYIVAPAGCKVQFCQLKSTSSSSGTYPNYAGNSCNVSTIATNGNMMIETYKDCEYLYFLHHGSLNYRVPRAVKKIVTDKEKLATFIADNKINQNGMVELSPINSYGLYINTNTWKWTTALDNAQAIIYKVVGGSKVAITASSNGACQFYYLKEINASNGDDVVFATGYEYSLINMSAGTSSVYDVPTDAEYICVLYLPLNATPYLAPQSIKSIVVNGISCIDFIGDSMTQMGYSAANPRGYYPKKVMQYLGIDGYNIGVGGENAATIFGRCDGIPYKLAADVTIPATTSQVQITLTNIYGQHLLPILQRYTSHDVVIDGIEGTLTTTQTDPAASNADYFFTRKASGNAYSAKAGDDVFVKDFKSTLNPHRAKIIWAGQNGGYDTDSTNRYGGDVENANDRARLIHMIKTYIDVCGCEYYMVLSPSRKTNDALEKEFAEAFGNRFFNVRMYMVKHGIDDAIALGYLPSSGYPTAQDIADMNNGIVPSSLRADATHFTENGFYTMAYALSIKIKEVWNL